MSPCLNLHPELTSTSHLVSTGAPLAKLSLPPGAVPKSILTEIHDRRESLNLYNFPSSSGEESGYTAHQPEVPEGDISTVTTTQPANAMKLLMQSRKPAQIVGGSGITTKDLNKRDNM